MNNNIRTLRVFDFEQCKICKRYDKWFSYCNHCNPLEDCSSNHFKPVKTNKKGLFNLCCFCNHYISNNKNNKKKCKLGISSFKENEHILICRGFRTENILVLNKNKGVKIK